MGPPIHKNSAPGVVGVSRPTVAIPPVAHLQRRPTLQLHVLRLRTLVDILFHKLVDTVRVNSIVTVRISESLFHRFLPSVVDFLVVKMLLVFKNLGTLKNPPFVLTRLGLTKCFFQERHA